MLSNQREFKHSSRRRPLNDSMCALSTGFPGRMKSTSMLRNTNAIENLNSGIVTHSRNVMRWQSGSMVVRWVSAGIVEAEQKFRRVQGYRDIAPLTKSLELIEAKEEAAAERVA